MSDAHDVAARYQDYEQQILDLKLKQRELVTHPESRSNVRRVDRFTNRIRGGRGYLGMDDRNSGGELQQFSTMTCAHCNCVKGLNQEGKIVHAKIYRDAQSGEVAAVHMLPAGDPGYCGKCHAYLCDDSVCNKYCTPLMRALEYNLPIAQRPGRETWQFQKDVY